jgi:16S rRNA C967 or C1407 C5-methylase (RsmB/RsmF family)
LTQRSSLFALPEFKAGLFEVQDEASQIVAAQVNAFPGTHVLDYCCGAGGKALAIAPSMQGKGQMYLHDIRTQIFAEAKKRLKRAGIQNAQFILPNDKKKKFIGKMDWVLADVPCSGSGTLRRNPDMKWRFQASDIEELVQKQREIFEKALSFVKHKGHIVYATCSILPEENEQQVDFFLKHFPVRLVKEPFQSFPRKGKMDGFYAATLQKT